MSRHEAVAKPRPFFSNTTYDVVKFAAQIVLPALGTLYFTLGNIWGFPNVEQVIGTITAVDVFLGVVLGISTKSYENSGAKYDGALVVDTTGVDKDVYSFEADEPLEDLKNKKDLTFKVIEKSP